MKIPLSLGPSYQNRTLNNIQRTVNWYPEETPEGWCLVSRPGLRRLDSVANNAACRGAIYVDGINGPQWFTVNGNTVYELDSSGADTSRGTISGSATQEVILCVADTATQVYIIIVQPGINAYYMETSAGSPTLIAGAGAPSNPLWCCFIDQYVVLVNGTRNFYLSGLADPTSWGTLRTAQAESLPDPITQCFNLENKLMLVGPGTIEGFYDTGNSSFPFERVQGMIYDIGATSGQRRPAATINGNLFFISSTNGANNTFWSIGNKGKRKISTPVIDGQINSQLAVEWEVEAWHELGHDFVKFHNFGHTTAGAATAGACYVWDDTFGCWHERTSGGTSLQGTYRMKMAITGPQASRSLPFAFDNQDGSVYSLDESLSTDGATPVAFDKIRDFGPIESGDDRVKHTRLRLDAEVKYDSTASPTLSATLQKSDNGGQSYDTGLTLSRVLASATTAQKVRLEARRLGAPRERYYRLTLSPQARIILKLAELEAEAERS